MENYTRYQVARLGLMTLENVEAFTPEFGPVINNVTSFRYLTTIPSCRDIPADKRSVFVAIISASSNFDKRELIRKTWFKHLQVAVGAGLLGPVTSCFVLGQPETKLIQVAIEKESKTYGDIIQIDRPDFYRNLSIKLIGLLNWVQRYCPKVHFILKVNDDVFVNVYNLAKFIQSKHDDSYDLFGSLPAISYPSRVGELKVSYEEWPWQQYPTHISGAAALLPGKVIVPLLAACQTTPLMPFDDVYLFGLCTEKAGLTTGFSSSYIPTVDHKPTCDLHAKITWLIGSTKNMINSFVATDDFYNNGTQCTSTGSNGMQRRVHSDEPFEFTFLQ